jgi:hypothetical protein
VDLRVIVDQTKAMCADAEVMIGAYCEDGAGSLHIIGRTGASCEGEPAGKAVVVCAGR